MAYYEDLLENTINIHSEENDKINNINKKNKHHHKFKIPFNGYINNKYHKYINIEFYSSGDTGTKIRDAVTGNFTPHLVGSENEDLYFTVSICNNTTGQTPVKLYYLTPEEYEKNHFCIVCEKTKKIWKEKRDLRLSMINNKNNGID